MTTTSSHDRWQRLVASGIVQGELPASAQPPTSWAITALMGAAAWLAALFLLFFLFLALEDVLNSAASALATGLVTVGVAAVALRYAGDRLFVTQLAIAFSLAGQAVFAFGIFKLGITPYAAKWLVVALFEIALIALVPQAAHRVLATLGAAAALLISLLDVNLASLFVPLLLAAFVAVHARILDGSPRHALWASIGTGVALALLAAAVVSSQLSLLAMPFKTAPTVPQRWIAAGLIVATSAIAAWILVRDAGVALASRAGTASVLAVIAIAAVSAYSIPAVPASLVMILMAFAAGRPALLGLGTLALIASLAYHYYALDATLLQKSAALGALGLVLLAARMIVPRTIAKREAADA